MKPTELEAHLERLHPESYGWALSCCGRNPMEAEDVLQSAYLKVISGKARFEERSSFRTWLFGVIRRTAQEAIRKAKARERRHLRLLGSRPEEVDQRQGDPSAAILQSMDEESSRVEAAEQLRRALAVLSERQREVLHLVFYQDLTIAQAAEVMGVSLGSARTHYERGKARLRALLKEDLRRDA